MIYYSFGRYYNLGQNSGVLIYDTACRHSMCSVRYVTIPTTLTHTQCLHRDFSADTLPRSRFSCEVSPLSTVGK